VLTLVRLLSRYCYLLLPTKCACCRLRDVCCHPCALHARTEGDQLKNSTTEASVDSTAFLLRRPASLKMD
jgi:hypothetical protein